MNQLLNTPRAGTAVPMALSIIGCGLFLSGPYVAERIGRTTRLQNALVRIGESNPVHSLASVMQSQLPESTQVFPVLVDWLNQPENREGRVGCVAALQNFLTVAERFRRDFEQLGWRTHEDRLAASMETAANLKTLLREFNEREPLVAQRETTYLVRLLGQQFERFEHRLK